MERRVRGKQAKDEATGLPLLQEDGKTKGDVSCMIMKRGVSWEQD